MKNPEKYLLVVLGCYVMLTIASMISDILLEPTRRFVPAPSVSPSDTDHWDQSIVHGSVQLTNGISGNVKLKHEVSGISAKNSTPVQPLSILLKYAKNLPINASSQKKKKNNNITIDANRRRTALRRTCRTGGRFC